MSLRHVAALCVIVVLPAVPRAGELRGEIRYRGEPPSSPKLEVTKDRRVCGESATDEPLLRLERRARQRGRACSARRSGR